MAKVFEGIDGKLAAWILAQRMFFVGTAPAGDGGHVNVSPKGDLETFRITGPHGVAYLDFIGSGAETIAHLRENGRIVIMLCAFEGAPRIVRLHGTGRVVQLGDPGFAALVGEHGFEAVAEAEAGARAVVLVDVDRVSDSCGYGVPLMRYEGKRPQLGDWLDRTLRQGPNALMDYVREKNATSLDGLPALDAGSLPDRS